MKFYESKGYQAIDLVFSFLLLNTLWLIACLPVITIFPATAALFGVMRGLVRDQEPGGAGRFFTLFKENFVQGLLVGGGWLLIGLLLLANLALGLRMTSIIRYASLILTGVAGLLYLALTPYLFPVMVHYKTSTLGVVRNSFVIALSQPAITFLAMLLLVALGLLYAFFPGLILLTGSLAVYLLYFICNKAFQRIDRTLV